MSIYDDAFADFPQAAKGARKEPLDFTGDFERALGDFEGFQPQQPQVSQETVEATQQAPVDTGGVSPAYGETQRKGREEAAKLGLSPYVTGDYGRPEPSVKTIADVAPVEVSPESMEATREFVKEEAAPTIGGIVGGIVAAPFTAGMSVPASIATMAIGSGTGAAVGELGEQEAKRAGLAELGEDETAPTDFWGSAERAAWRGGEEALWSAVPDALIMGVPQGARWILSRGQAPDVAKQQVREFYETQAAKLEYDGLPYTTADVASAPLVDGAEAVASNSYFRPMLERLPVVGTKKGERIEEIRGFQEEAIKAGVKEQVGKYTEPAESFIREKMADDVDRYISENFKAMNDFGVAGLIEQGFKASKRAQRSVANGLYEAIGRAMEPTVTTQKKVLVDTGILKADGTPHKIVQTVDKEAPMFPVDLTEVKQIGEDALDEARKLVAEGNPVKVDADVQALLTLADNTDYGAAAKKLSDLKGKSRELDRAVKAGTVENAAKRKRVVDMAIEKLDEALGKSLSAAEEAGVRMPDGTTLAEMKSRADGIWKQTSEDFQNQYIKSIVKNADFIDGSADKIGDLLIQNETAAKNIVKVLEDGRATARSADEVAQLDAAENAVRGAVMQKIFMPMESGTGKYLAPDVSKVFQKEATLRRLFGDEEYESIKKLANVIELQSKRGTADYLGFAQRARESGQLLSTLKAFTNPNDNPIMRIIKEGSATLLFAGGAGNILTSRRMIDYMTDVANPAVDPLRKSYSLNVLVRSLEEYNDNLESRMDEVDREKLEARQRNLKELQSATATE